MKLIQIINATRPLQELVRQPMQLRTAHRLSQMVNAINSEVEFFQAERNKLAKKYNPQTDTLEMKAQAQKEMEALLNFDVEWEHQPVVLKMSDLDDIKLSVADIQCLEGFVEIDYQQEEDE